MLQQSLPKKPFVSCGKGFSNGNMIFSISLLLICKLIINVILINFNNVILIKLKITEIKKFLQ